MGGFSSNLELMVQLAEDDLQIEYAHRHHPSGCVYYIKIIYSLKSKYQPESCSVVIKCFHAPSTRSWRSSNPD